TFAVDNAISRKETPYTQEKSCELGGQRKPYSYTVMLLYVSKGQCYQYSELEWFCKEASDHIVQNHKAAENWQHKLERLFSILSLDRPFPTAVYQKPPELPDSL
ncbi:hypothetical protein STEG23_033356, partial [Scotinomys teguina]